jgi:hypothetical protein
MSFSYSDNSGEENYNGEDSDLNFDFSLFDKDSINGEKSILISKEGSKTINNGGINKDSYKENDIFSNDSSTNFNNNKSIDNIFQQNLSNDFPMVPNFPPYLNPMVFHNIQNLKNFQINKINTDYKIKTNFLPLFNPVKKEEKVINNFIPTDKYNLFLKNDKSDKYFFKNRIINIKPENQINIDLINAGKEKRTCVRLSSIPRKYSPFDMIKLIDKYLKTEPGKRIYNSIYVPLAKVIGKNIGFCFVNLISPEYVISFYNTFNGKYFNNGKKPCTVVFSDQQNMNFNEENPLRRPIFFKDHLKVNE